MPSNVFSPNAHGQARRSHCSGKLSVQEQPELQSVNDELAFKGGVFMVSPLTTKMLQDETSSK